MHNTIQWLKRYSKSYVMYAARVLNRFVLLASQVQQTYARTALRSMTHTYLVANILCAFFCSIGISTTNTAHSALNCTLKRPRRTVCVFLYLLDDQKAPMNLNTPTLCNKHGTNFAIRMLDQYFLIHNTIFLNESFAFLTLSQLSPCKSLNKCCAFCMKLFELV